MSPFFFWRIWLNGHEEWQEGAECHTTGTSILFRRWTGQTCQLHFASPSLARVHTHCPVAVCLDLSELLAHTCKAEPLKSKTPSPPRSEKVAKLVMASPCHLANPIHSTLELKTSSRPTGTYLALSCWASWAWLPWPRLDSRTHVVQHRPAQAFPSACCWASQRLPRATRHAMKS